MVNKEPRLLMCQLWVTIKYSDTHIISPVHFPIFPYFISRTGLLSDLKASSRRCKNAVARMTPVPKCFPMKNKIGGMWRNGTCFDRVGNDTATRLFNKTVHWEEFQQHTKKWYDWDGDHDPDLRLNVHSCWNATHHRNCVHRKLLWPQQARMDSGGINVCDRRKPSTLIGYHWLSKEDRIGHEYLATYNGCG